MHRLYNINNSNVIDLKIPANSPILKYLKTRDINKNIASPRLEMNKNKMKTRKFAGDRFSDSDSDSDYENKRIYYNKPEAFIKKNLKSQDNKKMPVGQTLPIKPEPEPIKKNPAPEEVSSPKEVEIEVEVEEDKKDDVEEQIPDVSEMKLEDYTADDLLFNLKLIAELDKYDKLSCNSSKLSIDDSGYFQSFVRYFKGESRTKTIEKLNKIVDHTFKYINETFKDELEEQLLEEQLSKEDPRMYENNSQILQKFLVALLETTKGLDKLKFTYTNDRSMVTGIELIIDKIKMRADMIKKILKISV